jgi:tagatose-6-phosphate ketose/aldose isomerase
VAHRKRSLSSSKSLAELRDAPEREQRERGYLHTLAEILQQPDTWQETGDLVPRSGVSLASFEGPVLLTGSGSSHYVGESLEPLLARTLRRPVRAVPAGSFLTDGESYLLGEPAGTLVSFARSGDSPESVGAVDWFLEKAPGWRHILVTCNREGALAKRYLDRRAVSLVLLADRTNDRSLVMTSSFTNLCLAGRILGGAPPDVAALARRAASLFENDAGAIAAAAAAPFENAVYLGSGSRYGAARESALKMLEMTDSRVPTFAESFLGLRHGPLCAVRKSSLLVGFLSATEPSRSYERDLLQEIEEKELDPFILTVGPGGDVNVDLASDEDALVGVVVGQLLGLFRSLSLGLSPDAPSSSGVISRVVRGFRIH